LGIAAIPEDLPHGHDVAIERAIPDILARPQMLQQFLLADHPVALRHKVGQHLKHLRRQRDGHPGLVQLIALGIQAIVGKEIAHHPLLPPQSAPTTCDTARRAHGVTHHSTKIP
jgi:hypothetical protein